MCQFASAYVRYAGVGEVQVRDVGEPVEDVGESSCAPVSQLTVLYM